MCMDAAQAEILKNDLLAKGSIGDWKIEDFYGNGKSAVVMKASLGDQTAAVKVFHPELIERYGKDVQLERILREKSLIGAEHPNLVRIYDGGECPVTGYLFVVMEALPYDSLHQQVASIPLATVPQIIAQVASAARFLEDRNLAHRDIKPENIAITPDFSRAILLDLGVLRPIGASELTDVDQRPFIGTLRYSSPEFLMREEQDTLEGWRAISFYQLGAVLHDMLMRVPLFHNFTEPFTKLVEAVKSETPQVHSEDTRSAALASRCLVKNPNTRLELVNWADFTEMPTDTEGNLIAARERIRMRQKLAQAILPASQSHSNEEQRSQRHALDDLCNRLETRLAALMNELGCFPLRTTKSEKDSSDGFRTTICFEKDASLDLSLHLIVSVEVNFIDPNGGLPIFRASSTAWLSGEAEFKPDEHPTIPFFSGEAQALLDSPNLERQFIDALEQAYAFNDSGKNLESGGWFELNIRHEGESHV